MAITTYKSIFAPNNTLEVKYKSSRVMLDVVFSEHVTSSSSTVATSIAQGRANYEVWGESSEYVDAEWNNDKDVDLHAMPFKRTITLNPERINQIHSRLLMNWDSLSDAQKAACGTAESGAINAVFIEQARDLLKQYDDAESKALYDACKTMSWKGQRYLNDGIENTFVASKAFDASDCRVYQTICDAVKEMRRRGGTPEVLICSPTIWALLTSDEEFKELFSASIHVDKGDNVKPSDISNSLSYYSGGKCVFGGVILDVICDDSKACPVGFCCLAKVGAGCVCHYNEPIFSNCASSQLSQNPLGVNVAYRNEGINQNKFYFSDNIVAYPRNPFDILVIDTKVNSENAQGAMVDKYFLQFDNEQGLELQADLGGASMETLNGKRFEGGETFEYLDGISAKGRVLDVDSITVDGVAKTLSDLVDSSTDKVKDLSGALSGRAVVSMKATVTHAKGNASVTGTMTDGSVDPVKCIYILPTCEFALASKTFLGWSVPGYAALQPAGTKIVVENNVTVTATWSA